MISVTVEPNGQEEVEQVFLFLEHPRLMIFRIETKTKYLNPIGLGGNSVIFHPDIKVTFDGLPWDSGTAQCFTGRHYVDVMFYDYKLEEEYEQRGILLWEGPKNQPTQDSVDSAKG